MNGKSPFVRVEDSDVKSRCLPLSKHAASALGLRMNEDGKLVTDETSLEGGEEDMVGEGSEIVGWSGAAIASRSFILGNCFFAELSSLLLSVGGRRLTQVEGGLLCLTRSFDQQGSTWTMFLGGNTTAP